MKFGYVIGIGCKFLPEKFQESSSKNDEKIGKKLFFNVQEQQCINLVKSKPFMCFAKKLISPAFFEIT